ncbi:MAG TPA: hypothetical protein VFC53_06020 [Dehalococcoidia bacterium]|nr:hypothetical protein [Dehalococcoidia bacterium]
MTNRDDAEIPTIEDAATTRWLAQTLQGARERSREAPSLEAIDRMRARIFGEGARKKERQILAA